MEQYIFSSKDGKYMVDVNKKIPWECQVKTFRNVEIFTLNLLFVAQFHICDILYPLDQFKSKQTQFLIKLKYLQRACIRLPQFSTS